MTDINPIPIICQARAAKRPVTFSFYELDYVIHHVGINLLEKSIWTLLAIETNGDPELACLLSYQQMAYTMQADYACVHRALHRLVNKGFIQVNALPESKQNTFTLEDITLMRLFMLSLPLDGLLILKKVPADKPATHPQGIYRKPPVLLNLLKNNKQKKDEENE